MGCKCLIIKSIKESITQVVLSLMLFFVIPLESLSALVGNISDSLGVRTQDPNIKSVVLYQLS